MPARDPPYLLAAIAVKVSRDREKQSTATTKLKAVHALLSSQALKRRPSVVTSARTDTTLKTACPLSSPPTRYSMSPLFTRLHTAVGTTTNAH
ncbi:hypothetical protein B566_EDAN017387 [Ephemera danica]|nr:hypothetical protein B566_EDAN017387 [Ephemera danica]